MTTKRSTGPGKKKNREKILKVSTDGWSYLIHSGKMNVNVRTAYEPRPRFRTQSKTCTRFAYHPEHTTRMASRVNLVALKNVAATLDSRTEYFSKYWHRRIEDCRIA